MSYSVIGGDCWQTNIQTNVCMYSLLSNATSCIGLEIACKSIAYNHWLNLLYQLYLDIEQSCSTRSYIRFLHASILQASLLANAAIFVAATTPPFFLHVYLYRPYCSSIRGSHYFSRPQNNHNNRAGISKETFKSDGDQ